MSKFLPLFFILVQSTVYYSQSTSFRIPSESTPFTDFIDWRGKGVILTNREENSNRIQLTFVGSEPRSLWQETIVPKSDQPLVIQSDGSNYIYFLDQLKGDNGKFTFYQLNVAGNVKPTQVNFTVAFKKLGYAVGDLEAVDIQCTDKALVFLFTAKNKEKKSKVLLMGSMTHHNFLPYVTEVGEWRTDEDIFYYSGFSEDKIAFVQEQERKGERGYAVLYFNSKAEKNGSDWLTLPFPNGQFEYQYFGENGASYFREKFTGLFIPSFMNSQWRLLTVENGLCLLTYENKQWKKMGTATGFVANKNGFNISVYPTADGVCIQQGERAAFISSTFSKNGKAQSRNGDFFNPSAIIKGDSPGSLVFDAGDRWLLMNAKQLGTSDGIEFTSLKK